MGKNELKSLIGNSLHSVLLCLLYLFSLYEYTERMEMDQRRILQMSADAAISAERVLLV